MRARALLLFCVLMCLALSGCGGEEKNTSARTEDLAAFSIQLPEGWTTNIPEGLECSASLCVAGFTRGGGSRQAVTVSVVPNLGKTLDEILEETRAGMTAHEAVMHEVARSGSRVEYEGVIKENPARLVATFDETGQQVGILLVVDENDETRAIIGSLRMKNKKLDFQVR